MRVPSPTTGTTNLPRQPEGYLRAATPDLSGLTRGLSAMASGLADWEAKKKSEAEQLASTIQARREAEKKSEADAQARREAEIKRKAEQLARFKATEGFVEFSANANAKLAELKDSALPEDLNFAERAVNSYQNYEDEFIASLPEDIQPEFRMRTAAVRTAVADDAMNFQKKNLQLYQTDSLGKMKSKATEDIVTDPGNLDQWKKLTDEAIDNSAFSDVEKHYMKQENARFLETLAYKEAVREQRLSGGNTTRIPLVVGTQAGRLPVDMSGLDPKVVDKWEHVQTSFGRAVPVVSAFRDPERNAEAGGASKSRHQHGDAIDVDVSGMSKSERLRLIKLASAAGFNGVGVYDNSLHFDTAGKRAWGPSHGSESIPEWAASTVSQHLQGAISKTDIMPLTGAELWARLEQVESGGRQSAVSPKGAIGVAQVMPATAPEAAALAGLPWDENKYRTDEGYNRALGQAYLAKKMEEFGGDTAKALAAYNAGAGHVNEAVQKHGANWLSGMPQETQRYVQKILGSDTIDEDTRFLNVPYEDRIAVRKDVETEITKLFADQEKQRKKEYDARINDLLNNVQAGKAGRAEYEQMVEEGQITEYEDRKKILAAIENREKDGKSRREGQDRLRQGLTFDLTDPAQRNQLNAVFGEEGVEYMQRRDEEYVANTLAPLFNQAGGLPSDALGILKAQAVSSNPADMMYALQTLSVLENINKPAYDAQIPKDLAAKSDFNELMETTLPLKDRIEMLTDAPTQEMRTRKKMLKEEANEMLTNSADQEMAVRFATIVEELGAPPNSQVAQIAEAEWNALFVEAYSKYGGNRDAAVELATKQFTRVWKKSMQDGVEVFMKHSPEVYHAPIAGSHDWIREQVRNTLGLTEDETYMMVADRQTQIEVDQAQMKGEKPSPSWTVVVQRANGLWDIAREANGKPMRIRPVPTMYDMKVQEMNLRVESKKIEMQSAMELLTPYGMSITGAPKEILERATKVRSELDELLVAKDNAMQDAANAYKTPTAQEVERLQKKFDELQAILHVTYNGVIEEFPQAAEYAKVIDDLEAAKAKAEIELKAKRKPMLNESLDIFEGAQ